MVTLFLVNGQREPAQLKDTVWLFQPELVVEDGFFDAFLMNRPFWEDVEAKCATYEEGLACERAWRQPDLPEDLCLLRADGSPWLATIAHEADGFLLLSEAEREDLNTRVPALDFD